MNWSEEAFIIKKGKNTKPWLNVINDLNDKEAVRLELRIEKVIKERGDRLCKMEKFWWYL